MTYHTALLTMTAVASVAAAAVPSAVAQTNSPGIDGYLTRAGLMYGDRIYRGTADQTREAGRLHPQGQDAERQLYLTAMAALRMGDPQAPVLLADFAARYPASPRLPLVRIGIGDCLLAAGDFNGALREYERVALSSLAGTDREDLLYRRGYCDLMSGNYTDAEARFGALTGSADYGHAARFYSGYIAYARGDYAEALKLFSKADGHAEPECAAPYYTAQIRYRQSDWQQAASIARKLVSSPRVPALTPEMQRILGESLWHLSSPGSAERSEAVEALWEYAAAVDSPEPSALYLLGINEYDSGNYREAIGLLQRVIGGDTPLSQSAYLYLGQAYSGAGNTNAALMAYEHAYRMDYSRDVAETALYNYIAARIGGGRAPFSGTVSLLENFLQQYPDSRYATEVENYLVSGYLSENDYEGALAGIERIRKRTPHIEGARQRVLFVLGTRDYTNGNYLRAIERLQAARAISPSAGGDASVALQALLWTGDARYALDQYEAAVNDYQNYLKQAPAGDPNRATALYDLAYARFAARRYADALADFKRYTATGPKDQAAEADAYSRMGDCRYYAADFNGAAADYRRAFDLSPATGDYPLYQLALMKGLIREHRVKIQTLDDMIARYPGSPLVASALLEKGESYSALNDRQAAIATYTELTERFPSTAQGRKGMLQLAIARLSAGQRPQAVDTYRKVISRYPTSEEAALALDDLKRISAEDGSLESLTQFLATVPGAPSIDRSEYDDLSFDAAEKAYIRDDSTDRLEQYLKDYASGRHRAQALYYLAEAANGRGDTGRALELATELTVSYPDAEVTEEAMLIKADAEAAAGRSRAAFDTYVQLEERASTPAMRQQARLGVMRHGIVCEQWEAVIKAARQLSGSSTSGDAPRTETGWSYGRALSATGRYEEAEQQWEAVIGSGTADEYASRSAVDLARMQLDHGELDKAHATADRFISSNPPQQYWLARGFIVYSDILRRQGETFEADEYLRSLRNNYPGNEEEIFRMIDERLKDK